MRSRLRSGLRSFRALLTALTLMLAFAAPVGALELPYRHPEQKVRAVFLLNFAKFTEWPESAFTAGDAPLVLAIDDPELFAAAEATLRGRSVAGHPLVVRHYRQDQAGVPPHLLYLAESSGPPERFHRRPVLTVGGRPGFADGGGHIELLRRGGRLRFAVNRAALRRSGLEVSSQVLDLAVFVRDTEVEGR